MDNVIREYAAKLREAAQDLLDQTAHFATDCPAETSSINIEHSLRGPFSDLAVLCSAAKDEYHERRQRHLHLDKTLLGEPAWDILLDLFIQKAEGRLVSVSSACIASDVPATTGLRWLNLLEDNGLIRRIDCPADKRVVWLELTEDGFLRVAKILRERTRPSFTRPMFFNKPDRANRG